MDTPRDDDAIRAVTESALAGSAWIVDDMRVSSAGHQRMLRVWVARSLSQWDDDDHTTEIPPLSLDEVAEASRKVSSALDASDVTGAASYTLEVSSTGVSAALRTADHFRRNVGRMIELRDGDGAPRRARLMAAEPAGIRLGTVDADLLAYDDIGTAVVQVEFSRPTIEEDL